MADEEEKTLAPPTEQSSSSPLDPATEQPQDGVSEDKDGEPEMQSKPRSNTLCNEFVPTEDRPEKCATCGRPQQAHHIYEPEAPPEGEDADEDEKMSAVRHHSVTSARMMSSPSRSSLSQPRAPGAKAAHDMTKCTVGHAGPKFWDEMKARSEAVPMYDEKAIAHMETLSINEMVEQLLLHFQEQVHGRGAVSHHSGWCYRFFVVHDWYQSSGDLLCKLVREVYGGSKQRKPATHLEPSLIKLTVAACLMYWVHLRPHDWTLPPVVMVWNQFLLEKTTKGVLPEHLAQIEDARNHTYPLNLAEIPVIVLARQLSLIVHHDLAAISTAELKTQGWLPNSPRAGEAPNVLAFIRTHNNIGLWVGAMVLDRKTDAERAALIGRFAMLMDTLRRLGNYDSVFAIHKALTCSAVTRLSATWELVNQSANVTKVLNRIHTFCAPTANYAEYRARLKSLRKEEFHIPYLSLWLKDVAAVDSAEPTLTEDGKVVGHKLNSVAAILTPFVRAQLNAPPWPFLEPITALLHVALEPRLTWDDLHDKSVSIDAADGALATRPRTESLDSMDISTKLPVFRNSQEQQNIAREVDRLVSMIFATYDLNNDNLLQQSEFRLVLANFPFLGEFCDIDMDGDGEIDREEMRRCLRRAANAPDLSGVDMAYGNAIEVSVGINEDPRFYTLKFLLPDGQEHVAITRYSALRAFYENALQRKTITLANTSFQFPPKTWFGCQSEKATRVRRAAFEELLTDLCSNPYNWRALCDQGLLPSRMVGSLGRYPAPAGRRLSSAVAL